MRHPEAFAVHPDEMLAHVIAAGMSFGVLCPLVVAAVLSGRRKHDRKPELALERLDWSTILGVIAATSFIVSAWAAIQDVSKGVSVMISMTIAGHVTGQMLNQATVVRSVTKDWSLVRPQFLLLLMSAVIVIACAAFFPIPARVLTGRGGVSF